MWFAVVIIILYHVYDIFQLFLLFFVFFSKTQPVQRIYINWYIHLPDCRITALSSITQPPLRLIPPPCTRSNRPTLMYQKLMIRWTSAISSVGNAIILGISIKKLDCCKTSLLTFQPLKKASSMTIWLKVFNLYKFCILSLERFFSFILTILFHFLNWVLKRDKLKWMISANKIKM